MSKISVVFLSCVMVLLVGCNNTPPPSQQQSSAPKAQAPADPVKKPEMPPAKTQSENWEYKESQDTMNQAPIKMARTESVNTVEFGFPYAGAQHGNLVLRSHPRHGKDVILGVERGQFLSGIDGCKVLVRFDDGKPQSFWANPPADHSTTMIFISGHSKFASALKRSKKVFIEAPFFHEGERVFEFNVEGLKWETDPPRRKK